MADTIKISRQQLYNDIWSTAPTNLAKKYGVSYPRLKEACMQYNIPMPSSTYFNDKRRGISIPIPSLPESDTDVDIELPKKEHRKKKNTESVLSDKANTLCLLNLLYEYSDYDNILTMAEIQQKMKTLYGLEVDRRTVYSSMTVLSEMEYEISSFADNGVGYYLEAREFEPSEIRLLMDCIYSNTAIPKKRSEELIKKLQTLMPQHKRKNYRNLSIANSSRKSDNEQIFLNIDILDEAISSNKKVEFTYTQYNINKQLIERKHKEHKVCPYALVSTNEAYYLICASDSGEKLYHYRIDKIRDIRLSEEDNVPPPQDFDVAKYTDESVFMFGGDFIKAKFICNNVLIGPVIDKFGKNVKMADNFDGTFTFEITGSFTGLEIWASHYTDMCEVVEPAELRESVIKRLKNNVYGI